MKRHAFWIKTGAETGPPPLTDIGLKFLGVSLAACSFAFAVSAISVPREPYIPGIEYLAIFAQPNLSGMKTETAALDRPLAVTNRSQRVDFQPTGAIPQQSGKTLGYFANAQQDTIEILRATTQFAWIRKSGELIFVRKGETIDDLGPILAIENTGGQWRLKFEKTYLPPLAQQTQPQTPNGARLAPARALSAPQ